MNVRAAEVRDREWIAATLSASWGATEIVSRGRAYDALDLPGLLAENGEGVTVGLLTYRIDADGLEVLSLDASRRYQGIGTALLVAARQTAAAQGCARLWLITSNDNLAALRFYQRRGLRIVAVHAGAIDEARRIKPAIPLVGDDGIEVHDEIELAVPIGDRRL